MATETEPIPNLIMGNSEWVAGKSKKWDAFLKPKSEPVPNRISETAICRCAMSWVSRISCRREAVVHRVVDMGVSAVHRATDTAGACGVGRAPRAGVAVFPERPRVGSLRAAGDVFCVQPRVAGAVEGGDSERRFMGRVAVPGTQKTLMMQCPCWVTDG